MHCKIKRKHTLWEIDWIWIKMAEYKDVELISPHTFMWKNSHWKLPGDDQRDSCTSKATRKVKAESNQKQRQAIRSGPRRELRGKGRLQRRRPSMRSEQLKLHLGHPSPGVWLREEELPWLFGGSQRLRNGLWETSTQFGNSAKMLLSSQSKVERAEQNHEVDWLHTQMPQWISYPELS